jgi:hypothetical protein
MSRTLVAVLALGLTASCGKFGYEGTDPATDAGGDVATTPDASDDFGGPDVEDEGGNVFPDGGDAGPPPAFAVGSFVKPTSPGGQVVPHGLGVPPKALLLWTIGKPAPGSSADYSYAFGVSDAPGSSRSIANASRSGAMPSNASRRMALHALSIVQVGEMTSAEADVTSWDETSFTLAWPTNDPAPSIVHFIAIGGVGVSAKIVPWQAPTSPGTKSIAGAGFRPDALFHFYSGAIFTNPPPNSQDNGALGMGFADADGNQCAYQIAVVDGQSPTITARALRNDASVYMFSERPSPNVTKLASFASMDADGFTLAFMAAEPSPTQMFSLALAGVKAKVGAFDKPIAAAPFGQSIKDVGFRPGLVFLASVLDVAQVAGVSQAGAALSTGASDGKKQASSALNDVDAVSPSVAFGADDSSRVLTKLVGFAQGASAQAAMSTLDRDGFSLAWTLNDAAAARICYWALGSR